MSLIKKFFEKKKNDAKFKLAGPGRTLSETKTKPHNVSQQKAQATPREMSAAAQTAGAAALARIESQQQANNPNWSRTYLKAQIKRELETEKKSETSKAVPLEEEKHDDSGVYFTCPLIGPAVLPYEETKAKIKEFLYEQLNEDPALTACLIIHTCNKNKEKVNVCIETLHKYLDNILENPAEEKYRKIRVNNKVFQEKIACLEGSSEFLLGAGFELQTLPHKDKEETFWVFPEDKLDNNFLQDLLDALVSSEPIRPQLDRALKLFDPSQANRPLNIPLSFYSISAQELKREQQLRSEEADRQLQLRTKAMRERDELREVRKYRYCFIRIKFPDSYVLQGTFFAYEKFDKVKEFIKENLAKPDWEFTLRLTDFDLTNSEQSLMELRLPPASSLNIDFITGPEENENYLSAEVMALLQPL